MAINYFETSNRYTAPVRYFKANDPYYYEVDNIPIKQLEENAKFLKDQVDGLLKNQGREFLEQGETTTLDRVKFNELKPLVDGTNSKVRVMPGRFTARINDAYTKTPLQVVTQGLTGLGGLNFGFPAPNGYTVETANGTTVAAALEKWQSKTAGNATLMNGLFERSFVYPMKNNDSVGEGVDASDPNNINQTAGGLLSDQAGWPGLLGYLHEFDTDKDTVDILNMEFGAVTDVFRQNGRLESNFIKRWRGATRTSVVDVAETLEIEIPKFDAEEFFYFDTNGDKQTVESNQRIDLLFIYSKPVDESETTIPSYSNGSPRTLTKPTLGIVKGAGLGVNRKTGTSPKDAVNLQPLDGVTLMVPNSSDELADNTGFQTSAGVAIRGSFPSPDDLMNLAPLLSENLSTTSVALIGQSILPVAYVVVKKDAGLNSQANAIITNDDVIDIRPFFRTTELAYNERAGIAAATPQVSIANPVVTEAHLELVKNEIKDDYVSRIGAPGSEKARIVGAGTIKGGMFYGVEGALATYVKDQFNQTTYNGAKSVVESRYGYATNSIPDLPDWDISRWCQQSTLSSKGTFPNDRVNYFQWGVNGTGATTEDLKYSAFKTKPGSNLDQEFASTSNRVGRLGTNKTFQNKSKNTLNNEIGSQGITSFYFVEKTIQIDRSQISWARDYHVAVDLLNCVPLSARSDSSTDSNQLQNAAGTANIWVDKRENEFTIFISWSADDLIFKNDGATANNPWSGAINRNRDDGQRYAGFCVMNSDIMTAPNPNGEFVGNGTGSVTAGVAIYPSVSFQIYGIPDNIELASRTLMSQANPTLTLL